MHQALGFFCSCLCPPAMDFSRCKTFGRITQTHCHNSQLDPLRLLHLHYCYKHQGYLRSWDRPLYHQCITSGLTLQRQLNHPTYLTQKSLINLTVSCYLVHDNFPDDQRWIKNICCKVNEMYPNCLFVHPQSTYCSREKIIIRQDCLIDHSSHDSTMQILVNRKRCIWFSWHIISKLDFPNKET